MIRKWSMSLSTKVGKVVEGNSAKKALPKNIVILKTLIIDLEFDGHTLGISSTRWHNFGLIAGQKDVYHCHLEKCTAH